MVDSKIIGARLLKLRGERPREEVALAVGISVSALTMYETGKRIPRDEIKIKLAKYFSSSVGAIFFEQ